MRNEYIARISRKQAIKQMPWAYKIVKVDNGYRGFETVTDYETWKNQK